jgi:hypothetical protein
VRRDNQLPIGRSRIGDLAPAWHGKYDEAVQGYTEVSSVKAEEWG